jgi:hypothetical protein
MEMETEIERQRDRDGQQERNQKNATIEIEAELPAGTYCGEPNGRSTQDPPTLIPEMSKK